MKIISADEQLLKLKSLRSRTKPVSIVLESSAFRMTSDGRVDSASKQNAAFSLSGGGNISLSWSQVDECQFMCLPPKDPEENDLNLSLRTG